MMLPNRLLLLDLDCVLVYEREGQAPGPKEVMLLHEGLPAFLKAFSSPIMVLTHRARAEAHGILESIGIWQELADCLAAEDLLKAAVRSGDLTALMRRGLRKSLILPSLCRRTGLAPEQMAFVDDRQENVEDMLSGGIGLGLVAPFRAHDSGTLKTFELDQVGALFSAWADGSQGTPDRRKPRQLSAVERNAGTLPLTLRNDTRASGRTFNFLRSSVRQSRKALNGWFS